MRSWLTLREPFLDSWKIVKRINESDEKGVRSTGG